MHFTQFLSAVTQILLSHADRQLALADSLLCIRKIRTRRNRRHACVTVRLFIQCTFLTPGARVAAGIRSGILLLRTLHTLPELPAMHDDNPFVPDPEDSHAALQLLAGLKIRLESRHPPAHPIHEGTVQAPSEILHLPG